MEPFRTMLSGGQPNSLGRTIEVVDAVLGDPARMQELFDCYGSDDAVVRLRTSNALKRIGAERSDWLVPYIDPLIATATALDQASTQWTAAQLFLRLGACMTPLQRSQAIALMRRNLEQSQDWIVLNTTMETLADWSRDDPHLRSWLVPHLDRLASDPRKSVAGRAAKLGARLIGAAG